MNRTPTFVGLEFDGETSYHRIDAFGASIGRQLGPPRLHQHRLDAIVKFLQVFIRLDGRIRPGRTRGRRVDEGPHGRRRRHRRRGEHDVGGGRGGGGGEHHAAVQTVEVGREIEMVGGGHRLVPRWLSIGQVLLGGAGAAGGQGTTTTTTATTTLAVAGSESRIVKSSRSGGRNELGIGWRKLMGGRERGRSGEGGRIRRRGLTRTQRRS